jgi:hypothetical protein
MVSVLCSQSGRAGARRHRRTLGATDFPAAAHSEAGAIPSRAQVPADRHATDHG